MNFRMIGQVIGRVLCIEAALMLLPMIAAVIYDESPVPFLITIGITGGIGGGLFGSGNDCTRAQIVTFLYRAMK